MLTTDEFMAEARRRAAVTLEKRRKKKARIFTICASAASLVLIVGISVLFSQIELTPETAAGGAGIATVMADSSVGGSVLLGVICFVLGAAVALLCVRYARKKDDVPAAKKTGDEKQAEVDGDAPLGHN